MIKFKELLNVEKVLVRGNEFVIIGQPEDSNDESHNCDQMGCSTVEHVLYRGCCYAALKGYTESTQEVEKGAKP